MYNLTHSNISQSWPLRIVNLRQADPRIGTFISVGVTQKRLLHGFGEICTVWGVVVYREDVLRLSLGRHQEKLTSTEFRPSPFIVWSEFWYLGCNFIPPFYRGGIVDTRKQPLFTIQSYRRWHIEQLGNLLDDYGIGVNVDYSSVISHIPH